MAYQGFKPDLYRIPAVSTSVQTITFNKIYPTGTIGILTNDSTQPVYVESQRVSATGAVTFPTSPSTPKQGQIILPGHAQPFSLEDDDKFLQVLTNAAAAGGISFAVQYNAN
jgi:hypothetical protein